MTSVDLTVLPCWALIDFGRGVRIAGHVERIDIGGAPFVAITPHAHEVIKVNVAQVNSILPCDEAYARRISQKQWAS